MSKTKSRWTYGSSTGMKPPSGGNVVIMQSESFDISDSSSSLSSISIVLSDSKKLWLLAVDNGTDKFDDANDDEECELVGFNAFKEVFEMLAAAAKKFKIISILGSSYSRF